MGQHFRASSVAPLEPDTGFVIEAARVGGRRRWRRNNRRWGSPNRYAGVWVLVHFSACGWPNAHEGTGKTD